MLESQISFLLKRGLKNFNMRFVFFETIWYHFSIIWNSNRKFNQPKHFSPPHVMIKLLKKKIQKLPVLVYGITISRELCFVWLQPLIHVSPSEAYQFQGPQEGGAEGLLKTWAHYRNGIYLMKKSSLITNQRLLGSSDKKQWITFFRE